MWMMPVMQAMPMMRRRLESKYDNEENEDGNPEAENEIETKNKILEWIVLAIASISTRDR